MNRKKEKFFYAEVEAGVYDATIELTTPYYALAVETMDYLITEYLKKNRNHSSKILVLDIGAGTGNESIKILKKFPFVEVLAIDFCEPMELEYHKNWVKTFGSDEPNRYEYWVENFINCDLDKFTDYLKSMILPKNRT
jgi:SAM-dependent methyltransferase